MIDTATADRLIEDTERRNRGAFYTPTIWANYAHKLIAKQFGDDWRDDYIIWDNCCGTKQLTRDYRFKELYCSTLEQAELDISKNYNKEATSFQFDFLNDSLDDLKVKAPGLLDAFENNKPIMFFINPPYMRPCSRGCLTECASNTTSVIINHVRDEMRKKDNFSIHELVVHFLWRIKDIKCTFNLTNCNIACFTKPTWLCGEQTKRFRDIFLNEFKYLDGIMFNAGEFSDVSTAWGITFNMWKSGECDNKTEFEHTLVKSSNNEIIEIGHKTIYNTDNIHYIPTSKYISQNIKRNEYITNGIIFKPAAVTAKSDKPYKIVETKVPKDRFDIFMHISSNLVTNNRHCYITAGINGTILTKDNIFKACMIYAIRNVIQTNWIIDKDLYIIDPDKQYPESFIADCFVYTLFSNYAVSMQFDEGSLRNDLFWMSKNDMHCPNNDDDRFAYQWLSSNTNSLSPEAKVILDRATDLTINSLQYRGLFNESHPEYQINNWDAGWFQLKALLKEFMPDDLKAFRALHKRLGNKIKQQVYELGLLRQ